MFKKIFGTTVIFSFILSTNAYAGSCDILIEATASMAFSTKEISINKTCKEVNLTLKNSGTLPKAAMGHNLVITKKADMQAVLADGSNAGLSKNFVKENDNRVVAYTAVIGGGESTSIKFKTDKLKNKDAFTFFCSFPGHSAVMNGVIKIS